MNEMLVHKMSNKRIKNAIGLALSALVYEILMIESIAHVRYLSDL